MYIDKQSAEEKSAALSAVSVAVGKIVEKFSASGTVVLIIILIYHAVRVLLGSVLYS